MSHQAAGLGLYTLRHWGAKNSCGQGHAMVTVLWSNPSSTVHEEEGLGGGERREGTLEIS